MKILQTCLSLSWGGMEMYTLHTSILLSKAGHEVNLLCADDSRLKEEAEKEGIKCFPVSVKIPILKSFLKTTGMLRKTDYDIIHAEASKDLWFIVPALFLAMKRIPLLLTKHVGSKIIKRDFLHRMLYKRVDLALAISEVIKRNLIETTPLDKGRIELLHDAIDVNRFDPARTDRLKIRNEFAIKENEILIGMTGRFSPGKGHEEFLSAARELNAKYINLRFMIVGEASRGENKYAEIIKATADQYGLSDKMIFTGYRSDIPEILAAFDIYLFPSHAEAFGLALVEAMSMELPTVCSNSDGVLDVAVEGVTSYMFARGEQKDLVSKVESFIKNAKKRKEFGKAGRDRVLNNFNFDLFTKKLVNIYEKQLSAKIIDSDKAA
jgi:glycosyltransferase involved in cell wall biosynthesis